MKARYFKYLYMKYIYAILVIAGICFLGDAGHKYLHIPLPGNILGMVILFLGLTTGIIKLHWIKSIADLMMRYMIIFFVPSSVGIILCVDILTKYAYHIALLVGGTTVLVCVVTGWTVQLVKKVKK